MAALSESQDERLFTSNSLQRGTAKYLHYIQLMGRKAKCGLLVVTFEN